MTTSTSQKVVDELGDTAKQLAPWRSGLSWWVVLIEGAVLAIVGLLIILDPAKANIRAGLLLSLALLICGLLQSWMLFREKAPESVDGIIGARAAIGVFSGLVVLWLFMGNLLTAETALLVLGLGALSYGALGIFLVLNSLGSTRNAALIETIFFTLFGLVVLYTRYEGPAAIITGITIIGWLALILGVVLIIYAFIRRNREEEMEQTTELASTVAGSAQPAAAPRDTLPPSGSNT